MNKEQNTEASDNSISIAYQNKDISSKYLASMHGSTFADVLGIDIAPLERNEPTELPAIEVSDMMIDNLFLLTDGSYAIIDYESKYNEENKIKYLNYVARLVKTLYNRNRKLPYIRIIIIYTADVKEGTTNPVLDVGQDRLTIREIFLTNWDTENILTDLEKKVTKDKTLSEPDQIKIIMVPLSAKGKENKINAIRKCIDIINLIQDEQLKIKLYGGLIAFTDKIIDSSNLEEIRRRLQMTKIEKMYYDEKIEAINNKMIEIASNFLRDGMSTESVSRNTGLDLATVEELNKSIQEQKQTVTV